MRLALLVSVSISLTYICPNVYSQSEITFINAYNRHIDENGKLDSITMISVEMILKATGVINSTPVKTNRVIQCKFMSDGKEIFIDSKTGGDISEFYSNLLFKRDFKNAILARLEFISSNENPSNYRFLNVTDSITTIQREVKQGQKYVYKFDSKSKDLLQIDNNAMKEGFSYNSTTKFLSFQIVDGVVVPKDILFSNDFAQGTVTYSNVKFHKIDDTY